MSNAAYICFYKQITLTLYLFRNIKKKMENAYVCTLYIKSDRLGVYSTLVRSWYWMLQTWNSSLVWICSVSTRYLFVLWSSIDCFFFTKLWNHSISHCMQCMIDLKDNVLRIGGGEVAVPFLQGEFYLYVCTLVKVVWYSSKRWLVFRPWPH